MRSARREASDVESSGPSGTRTPFRDAPLPRPPVLLVYDFAVDAWDVDVDSWGINTTRSAPADEQRCKVADMVQEKYRERGWL